jgi:hypothetical protein
MYISIQTEFYKTKDIKTFVNKFDSLDENEKDEFLILYINTLTSFVIELKTNEIDTQMFVFNLFKDKKYFETIDYPPILIQTLGSFIFHPVKLFYSYILECCLKYNLYVAKEHLHFYYTNKNGSKLEPLKNVFSLISFDLKLYILNEACMRNKNNTNPKSELESIIYYILNNSSKNEKLKMINSYTENYIMYINEVKSILEKYICLDETSVVCKFLF